MMANQIRWMIAGGVIGRKKFSYDQIKDEFACTYRGKIDAKGKGELDMYFVE